MTRRPAPPSATVGLSQLAVLKRPLLLDAPISARISIQSPAPQPLYDVHMACEVGVVLQGEYRRLYEGLDRRIGPGQVWVCGAWEPHGHQVVKNRSKAAVIVFRPDFLWDDVATDALWSRLLMDHSPENRRIALDRDEAKTSRALALEIVRECSERGPLCIDAARLALKRLLLPLVRRSKPALSRTSLSDFDRTRRAIEMVNERLPAPVTLGDACRAANLAPSQFSAVFRRTTGVTFGRFAQRARVARAAQEILTTDTKLTAVAAQWGYTDASHLNRVFRKFFNCTPREYRTGATKNPGGVES